MEMSGEYRIPAPRDRVWAALNDPAVLKACIPGCDALEMTSPTTMTAAVTTKVGPVKAKFTGAVTLSDIRPPEGYTISGEGKGGVAGFAKGGADVALVEDGDGTILRYTARAQVGGKLAQLGARLIDSTAKKLADEFFGAFSARFQDPADPAPAPAFAAAPPAPAPAAVAPEAAPEPIDDPAADAVADGPIPLAPSPEVALAEAGAREATVEQVEHAIEDAEERVEVAAGKGFLGGPVAWGFFAVAIVIIALMVLR